jgi:Tol biopolymer transport system component
VTAPLARLTAALADRYRIERELGQGGMATVYLAHDLRHDRPVAVKVLRPELSAILGAERFLAEIKTTANLQHPHILPLHDSGEADGLVYYVMPYVEGESLRDRLPVDDAVRIASEVADALGYAHGHGIVHRDIKPENILLHGGHALVADFGIALAASLSEGGTRLTETGMSLGTPHYMAPEQAMGEKEITPRADVYALGCVLYEMLVGEPPFTGPTAQAIIARVMTEAPRSLTLQRHTVPAHIEAAVRIALEKLPADRFASAQDFAEALAGRGAPLPATRSDVPALAPAAAPWRRRFQVAVVVALAALALAAWGWARAREGARRPVERQFISLGDSVHLQVALSPALALSPDGAKLAFVGDSLGRLWVKRRDQLDPTPLPGTEHASNAVFSPDGNWIAYIAEGRLRKIRADGGASITLADSARGGFGGPAWLDDDSIAYVDQSQLGLRLVSASGGPSRVALPDSALGGLGVGPPNPLPHARGVLFPACASGCVTMSLRVLDLRTGHVTRLLDEVGAGWYLPTGHLLYVRRDGVALVAPFDLGTHSITGPAVPVLEGVAQNNAIVQLAFSATGTLVYGLGAQNNGVVTILRVSPSGATTTIDSTWTGQFNSAALSPDGRRIAVGVATPGAGLNIWIKQLDRGPFARLTFSGHDRRPVWSPDGRRVAFVRDSGAGSGGDVYVRAVDGGGSDRRLVHLDRPIQEVDWSRDGRWLLVRTDNAAAGAGDIVGVRLDGDTTPVPLVASRFTELGPALSPDGRWLAYQSDESGTSEIYVRPFPRTDQGRYQISNGGGEQPAWSADGKALYFIDGDNRLVAAQVRAGTTFEVPTVRTLFDTRRFTLDQFHRSYVVTGDGRFVFIGAPRSPVVGGIPLVRVDNWFADVRAKLAGAR